MIYLLLSILASSLLFIIFKLFSRFRVALYPAIAVNYLSALLFGLAVNPQMDYAGAASAPWLPYAVLIGAAFFFMFCLIGLTAQKIGIAVSSVAAKMSLVVPVVFAVFLYNDSMPAMKIAGICLALVGVYLVASKGKASGFGSRYLYLPLIVFAGSGLLDTAIKYTGHNYLQQGGAADFIPAIFLFAFLSGIIYCAFAGCLKFNVKTLLWGTVFGVVNYFSIYFLIRALQYKNLESSVVFPLNNMGIVAVTTLAAFFLFKEKLLPKNWAGVLLSIAAILIITLS